MFGRKKTPVTNSTVVTGDGNQVTTGKSGKSGNSGSKKAARSRRKGSGEGTAVDVRHVTGTGNQVNTAASTGDLTQDH